MSRWIVACLVIAVLSACSPYVFQPSYRIPVNISFTSREFHQALRSVCDRNELKEYASYHGYMVARRWMSNGEVQYTVLNFHGNGKSFIRVRAIRCNGAGDDSPDHETGRPPWDVHYRAPWKMSCLPGETREWYNPIETEPWQIFLQELAAELVLQEEVARRRREEALEQNRTLGTCQVGAFSRERPCMARRPGPGAVPVQWSHADPGRPWPSLFSWG